MSCSSIWQLNEITAGAKMHKIIKNFFFLASALSFKVYLNLKKIIWSLNQK